MTKALWIAALLSLLDSNFAWASSRAREVYFDRDSDLAWRNCYAVSPEEALAHVRGPDFSSLSAIVQSTAPVLRAGKIILTYLDPADPSRSVSKSLVPCPFTLADQSEMLECDIEVQSASPHEPVNYLGHNTLAVHRAWSELGTPLLDCKRGLLRTVRNSWRQPVTRAILKTLRYFNENGIQWIPSASRGVVLAGGSSHPLQRWSARLELHFSDSVQMELCDASVDEISVPEHTPLWAGKSWCPWGLEVTRVSCSSDLELLNPRSHEFLRLDLSAPTVQSACEPGPSQ